MACINLINMLDIKSNLICLFGVMILLNIKACHGIFEFNINDKVEPDSSQHTSSTHNIIFTNEELLNALTYAENHFKRLIRLEDTISNSRVRIYNDSISFGQLLDSLPNNQSDEYDKIAQVVLKASLQLVNKYCISHGIKDNECTKKLTKYTLPESDYLSKCKSIQKISKKKGPHAYRRLLPPMYSDGLYKMASRRNHVLPKHISNTIFQSTTNMLLQKNIKLSEEGVLDHKNNVGLVQWAQFIEHDLVKTVVRTMGNKMPIECCEKDLTAPPPRYVHPACAPLRVEEKDGLNIQINCLNYVRSALGVNPDCTFGPAEQINQATNTLDLSQLYGISNDVTNTLRSFKNGELMTSYDLYYPCLPESSEGEHFCMHEYNTTNNTCYKSGDTRVNLNPYVTTLYTIFLRSHNNIARDLRKFKKSWKDEKLFQTARKINTAIYNKIIYEEWARVVLGPSISDQINSEDLSTLVPYGVSNEFATAGIRFYYSMMPGNLHIMKDVANTLNETNVITKSETMTEILKIQNEFYKPRNLGKNNELENIMNAVLTQNAMAMDMGYVDDVTRHLYRYPDAAHGVGTDVLALDIIRGRDHGLSAYIKYFKVCTNNTIHDWTDLKEYIGEKDIECLQSIYQTVNKIDLVVGAIAEKPMVDSAVGPTLACIIGEQLSNTRRTDPNFYMKDSEKRFNNIASQYTGARLMCDTTKLQAVPKNIFRIPSAENSLINCSEFHNMSRLSIYT